MLASGQINHNRLQAIRKYKNICRIPYTNIRIFDMPAIASVLPFAVDLPRRSVYGRDDNREGHGGCRGATPQQKVIKNRALPTALGRASIMSISLPPTASRRPAPCSKKCPIPSTSPGTRRASLYGVTASPDCGQVPSGAHVQVRIESAGGRCRNRYPCAAVPRSH